MKDTERRAAAKAFSEYWKDRGYEKGESQPFWLSLLRDVLGVESPEKFITFEEQVVVLSMYSPDSLFFVSHNTLYHLKIY